MYSYKLQGPNTFAIFTTIKRFSHTSRRMERSYAVRQSTKYGLVPLLTQRKTLGRYQCAEHPSIKFLRRRRYPKVKRGVEQRCHTRNA